MKYSSFKIREIVGHAVSGTWSIPEFKRGFIWKPAHVRDFAEALWLNYPVGSMLIWDGAMQKRPIHPKNVNDAKSAPLWLVDGQQRTTALCILAGREPRWWSADQNWKDIIRRYEIRFDIGARKPPFFVQATAAILKNKTNQYIAVQKLLDLDLNNDNDKMALSVIAKEVKANGLCRGMAATGVKTRLKRVSRICEHEIVGIISDHNLKQLAEISALLNSKQTPVSNADMAAASLILKRCRNNPSHSEAASIKRPQDRT